MFLVDSVFRVLGLKKNFDLKDLNTESLFLYMIIFRPGKFLACNKKRFDGMVFLQRLYVTNVPDPGVLIGSKNYRPQPRFLILVF